MKHPIPLQYDSYYHIYNRGINGEDLFRVPANCKHFMDLYYEYLDPVCETFAWVLMRNHFHFLVRILHVEEIGYMKPKKEKENITYPVKKKYNPTQQFGNLFNAYAKTFNTKYDRTGSLFESPFRRIEITNEEYLKQLIYYIHNNPVHHGFCDNMNEYSWSSYKRYSHIKPEEWQADKISTWFASSSDFFDFHQQGHDVQGMELGINEE